MDGILHQPWWEAMVPPPPHYSRQSPFPTRDQILVAKMPRINLRGKFPVPTEENRESQKRKKIDVIVKESIQ